MKKHIYTKDGRKLIRIVESTPKCSEDFCDRCGECLACYGNEDPCVDGRDHFWVQYGEEEEGEEENEVQEETCSG